MDSETWDFSVRSRFSAPPSRGRAPHFDFDFRVHSELRNPAGERKAAAGRVVDKREGVKQAWDPAAAWVGSTGTQRRFWGLGNMVALIGRDSITIRPG
jgi:hypothetical protein